jgi:hypothetical protein
VLRPCSGIRCIWEPLGIMAATVSAQKAFLGTQVESKAARYGIWARLLSWLSRRANHHPGVYDRVLL